MLNMIVKTVHALEQGLRWEPAGSPQRRAEKTERTEQPPFILPGFFYPDVMTILARIDAYWLKFRPQRQKMSLSGGSQ